MRKQALSKQLVKQTCWQPAVSYSLDIRFVEQFSSLVNLNSKFAKQGEMF